MTHLRHQRPKFAVMHNTAFSRMWEGVILGLRRAHETARVHYAAWRRGGSMVACGRGATAEDADDRRPQFIYPYAVPASDSRISPRPVRQRVRRGPKRSYRVLVRG